ncbi:hypothetical protein D3C80_2057110 [compost metagenome]
MSDRCLGKPFEDQAGDHGRAGAMGIRQDHRHFLTPVACHQVGRAAYAGREHPGNLLQAGVASRMPVSVVVLFEMVDIDHQQRQ